MWLSNTIRRLSRRISLNRQQSWASHPCTQSSRYASLHRAAGGIAPTRFFVCKIGAQGETRTRKIWLLRPTRIPIPSPGLNYYNNTQGLVCQLIWYQETGSNRPRTDFQSVALPTELSWFWRKTEESNPIRFLGTGFSRPVAGPTPLHHLPKVVSVAGIEPTLERPKRSVIPFHHTEFV